jgi:FtsX-like permease family
VPALLGPIAAVLAARRPARAAARVTVVDAFRGRPPAHGRGTLVPIGAVVTLAIVVPLLLWFVGAAAAPALVLYAGAVVVFSVARALAGLLALAPRLAGRAPLPLRLVLRGLGRQQTRAAVVIGVLAVLVAAVVAGFALRPGASPAAVASATGVCLFLALAVIGPTAALGAVESDPDVRLAVAIGATPALRRRLLGLEAGLQAFVASLIGIPAGLLTAALELRTFGMSGIVVPWLAIGMVAIGVPVTVGTLVALLSRALPVAAPARRIA